MPTYAELLKHRAPLQVIKEQARRFLQSVELEAVIDAVPCLLLIVNQYRQVIYANQSVLDLLPNMTSESVLGLRPGELLDCDHAGQGCHGCGTSEACATCGAARAIASSQEGNAMRSECRLHQHRSDRCLDLRVSTAPIVVDGTRYSVVALEDTSSENRRRALERIFFHDLLNTLGALTGYVQLLDRAPTEEAEELTQSIQRLLETLAEEIRAQRDLAAAENNDLVVRWEMINSRELLEHLAVQYRSHPAGQGCQIAIDGTVDSANFRTDQRLVRRILGNMVKNALEATPAGQRISLGCQMLDGRIIFSVHNPAFIPRDVQLQIFHRAYSTKGTGRGLGTYSMKLLGEKYLGGKIIFTSTQDAGTTFTAAFELPAA